MKYLFKLIRLILTPPILFIDWITTPRSMQRSPEAQQSVDEQTRRLALYHYRACPFCIKVRRQIKRLGLNIELRNAQHNPAWRDELRNEGGKVQVPCLRIQHENGQVEWMYESDTINRYLHERFANPDGEPAVERS